MQDDLSRYCWFGKYFDQHGNKKFVSLSKTVTQDPDEADEMMQERIPEPYTKFVFCGSISQANADSEGYQALVENYQIPAKLYHATYTQFLNSIQTNGLGNTTNKMWTDSRQGVVYLAKDPWEAESYAEEAEWLDDKENAEEYLENIVILEIDTDRLSPNNLYRDENLLPGGDEVIGFEYHGIIPWEACKVFDNASSVGFAESYTAKAMSKDGISVEEKDGHFELYKDNILICTCDSLSEVKEELKELSSESSFAEDFRIYENLWLDEWVDANGNKINNLSKSNQLQPKVSETSQPVFIWDIYLDPRDKGTWLSAEKDINGKYQGTVYETPLKAQNSAETHLEELEDEGELEGRARAYRIDIIAVPVSQVDDMTLDWSGI